MLLVKVFANAVRQVPTVAKALQKLIKAQKWNGERKTDAIHIVYQLETSPICEPEATIEIVDGRFGPIFLTLLSSDLDRISMERDKYKITEYVQKLIEDINSLTCEIVLEYGGRDYDKKRDVFEAEIYWYI